MAEDEGYLFLNEGGFVPGMYRRPSQSGDVSDRSDEGTSPVAQIGTEPLMVGDVGETAPDEA